MIISGDGGIWNASIEGELFAVNATLPNGLNLSGDLMMSSGDTNRTGKTRWYNRIWREKMVAPNVEAGSSSSESFDSWSMECDCKQTTRTKTSTTTAATTSSTTTATTATTATTPTTETTASTPRTTVTTGSSTGSPTTAPRAFDDDDDDDDSFDESMSITIGDKTWRRRYRTWLRKCGCDQYYYNQ
ncbi:hypothetical protein CHUAL_007651 [Chamberlinius hualienensis]